MMHSNSKKIINILCDIWITPSLSNKNRLKKMIEVKVCNFNVDIDDLGIRISYNIKNTNRANVSYVRKNILLKELRKREIKDILQ